ncbi:MAG: leucine--tRNA ligase [Candidatus Moraniibacteriota bacterium]|nr:MAG: leucine--tRNA ligase [Candidatus Moranbacteria bacterium]
MRYDPKKIEKKWQKAWEKDHPKPKGIKGKYYVLDMFPYPSGDGLHVGHVENFTATDIYARFMRFQGYEVIHPIGWDAFGLPAENFAIKTGIHPDKKTRESIKNFTRQIKSIGLSYDWERELNTSSPEYYRWTQWMFLFLYKNGLAYKKKAKVNWCPSCQTVLANEQVIDGKCERSGDVVIQKDLEQWFFKITDFIEPTKAKDGTKVSGLLSGLDRIDWPESTKAAQRHWIGRSGGAEVVFPVAETEEEIRVFTTRLDTIYGCTYVVVAPEHPIVSKLANQIKNTAEVEAYLVATKKKTDLERTELNKEKAGVLLDGIEAVHPFTGERLPVYAADYVLSTYGTGAVMGVPAHDERDAEFARKYQLELKPVIAPFDEKTGHHYAPIEKVGDDQQAALEEILSGVRIFTGDGKLHHSKEFDGLLSAEAREKMVAWLKKEGLGKKVVNYRLRDWLISRQRYWGAPIPIIYCEECGAEPVPERDLPVKLPTDVDFRPDGESPLVRSKSFHRVKCPKCGKKARRESDTMDTFVCSSWYYLRYADPKNIRQFAAKAKLEKYLPVDFYMGGAEHTVLHLLYARFFTKALRRHGYVGFDEPFMKLRHQGMILAHDGHKMSKSKGNVVNPDQVIEEFGADSLRLYEMFMGPLDEMKAWNTASIIGLRRFLEKVWKLQSKTQDRKSKVKNISAESAVHKTIKKVTEDVAELKFNTAISSLMILVNGLDKQDEVDVDTYRTLVVLLAPFAPHVAEELWEKLGNKKSIFLAHWPKCDPKKIREETKTIAVQVNGKVRGTVELGVAATEAEAKALALADPKVSAAIAGKEIRKCIYVPGRIVNFVVS